MGKGKLDEKDEALLVGSTSTQGSSSGGGRGGFSRGRGRGRRGGSRGGFRKPTGKCWNCGEKGHFKNNCPHPKKDNSPKKMGSANADAESDSDGNGVWAMDANSDSDGLKSPLGEAWAVDTNFDLDNLMPALEALEDSDDDSCSSFDGALASDGLFFGEEDWFSEPEEVIAGGDMARGIHKDSGSDSGQEIHSTSEEVLVAVEPSKPGQYVFVQAELYNSGCTRHISPY